MIEGGSLFTIGAFLVGLGVIERFVIHHPNRQISTKKTQNESIPSRTRSARLVPFLDLGVGALLIVWGQYLISNKGECSFAISRWLNDTFMLQIDNLDNVLFGLPLLWTGSFFIIRLLLRLQIFGKEHRTEASAGKLLPMHFPRRRVIFGVGIGLIFAVLLALLANKQYSLLAPMLWLGALGLFAGWFWKWDRQAGVALSPNITRKDLLWMLGLVLAGLVVTSYRLQDVPNQLMGDEGTFWTTARDIATGVYKPPVFGLGVYTFGVLSSIAQSWVLDLFGLSLWAWRFSSVLAGVAAVPLLYLLARELFNRRVAIASCVAMLSLPYFLAFARLGYNNIQAVFVVTLAFYLFYCGFKRSSAFYLLLGGYAAGLGIYTYSAAMGAFYVILLFLACGLFYNRHNWRWLLKMAAIVALGWALVSLPVTVFVNATTPSDLRVKSLESIFFNTGYGSVLFNDQPRFLNAARFEIDKTTLFFSPELYAIMLLRGTARSIISLHTPYLVSEHFIFSPLAGPVGVLFFIVGSFFSLARFRQKRSLFLWIWLVVNLLVFSAANTFPPRHQHLVGIIPVIAILSGLGLVAFIDLLASMFPRLRGNGQAWVMGLLAIWAAANGLSNYFVTMPGRYLPSMEQIVNWNVLYSSGQPIYYLYQPSERPDFRAYIQDEFRKDVLYQVFSYNDLLVHPEAYALPRDAVVFYSNLSDQLQDPMQALTQAFGALAQAQNFFNQEGNLIGRMVWTGSMPRILPSDAWQELLDSYARPSAWLFLVLAALLVFCAVFRRAWLVRAPAWLTTLVDGIAKPFPELETSFVNLSAIPPDTKATFSQPVMETGSAAAKLSASAIQAELTRAGEPTQAELTTSPINQEPCSEEKPVLKEYLDNQAPPDKNEIEHPFIEISFRLRINLPTHRYNGSIEIPRRSGVRSGRSPAASSPRQMSRAIQDYGNRFAAAWQSFLAQNTWLPGMIMITSLALASAGQSILMEHFSPEPGIWYLIVAGVIFTLFSFTGPYTPLLQDHQESEVEYLVSSSTLRMRLAIVAFFFALLGISMLNHRSLREPCWDIFAAWISSILLYLLAFAPKIQVKKPTFKLKENWQTSLPLGIILVIGFALRFYQLGIIPGVMENDEGKVGVMAVRVINGTLNNMFQTFEGYGTLHFFLMSLPVRLFGQTIMAVRMNTAILGLLTLPVIFLLARQMFGRKIALVSTALLSVAHLHFHFSRVSPTAGSLDPLLASLSMLFIYRGVKSRRMIDWALAGMIMGMGMYFYVGARVLIFILAGFLILQLILNRQVLKENRNNLLALAGAFLVVALPMLLWSYLNPEAFNARANQVGIFSNGWLEQDMLQKNISALGVLAEQFANAILIFNYHYPIWFYGAQTTALGPVTGIAFVLGILAAVPRLREPRYALLCAWFGVTLLIGQVLVVDPTTSAYRTLGLIPAVCILAAVALVRMADYVQTYLESESPIFKNAAAIILCLVLLFECSWNARYYFGVWANEYRYTDANSTLASLIGEYLGEQPPGTQAYMASTADFRTEGWYSINYLSRSTPIADISKPLADVIATIKPGSQHTLFIIPRQRESELSVVQAAMPGGQIIKKYVGSELYFIAYTK
jgi:4-amino-4-deoxy-L-arabinose transferase-like glycosyltransferase